MRYLPHTDADVRRMLDVIGQPTLASLFASIPERLRHNRPLDLPAGLDEASLRAHLGELAEKNVTPRPFAPEGQTLAFLGAGVHPHIIPAAVDLLLTRAEFYTAYTPYQPEVSQGTLQAVFEYQTTVCELTGLDVANASLYDGASACAEAAMVARRATGRRRIVFAGAVHPEYIETTATYAAGLGLDIVRVAVDPTSGAPEGHALDAALGDDVAAVIVQNPSFHGVIWDVAEVCHKAKAKGAVAVIVTTDPVAYAVCRSPGEAGADIAVGEGMGLAVGSSLGGPGLGLFAMREALIRQMPGRLIGETLDKDGARGYVLTLATREQHIRREKATSNICSNEGLVALAFTINTALLGKTGLVELARQVYAKTAYLRDQAAARLTAKGYSLPCKALPVFGEVLLDVPGGDADRIVSRARGRGVIPGVALGRWNGLGKEPRDRLLVGVSELHRRADIDKLIDVLEEVA